MSDSFSPLEGLEKERYNEITRKYMEKGSSEIEASPSWDELPIDLLKEIMSRITLSDQVRFLSVCKRMLALDIPLCNPTPWIICYHDRFEKFRISSSSRRNLLIRNQINKKVYTLYKLPYSDVRFTYGLNLRQFHTVPHCFFCIDAVCKSGWIFYSVQNTNAKRTNFLLFSPLTKQVIKLPSILHWRDHYSKFIKTFSTDPNSPDCVFLVLHHNANFNKITIKTLQRGDKKWTSREFVKPDNFDGSGCIPLYMRENFYFVFPAGNIASYNITRGEWKVQTALFDYIGPEYHVNYLIYQGFQLNGDLILIAITRSPIILREEEYFGFVTKFNRSTNVLVPLKSLGGHALFIDNNSCSAKIVDREARNNGVLPNKIYHLRDSRCCVYSLEEGKLTYNSTRWNKVANINGDFWFEPPHHIVKKNPWARRPS